MDIIPLTLCASKESRKKSYTIVFKIEKNEKEINVWDAETLSSLNKTIFAALLEE